MDEMNGSLKASRAHRTVVGRLHRNASRPSRAAKAASRCSRSRSPPPLGVYMYVQMKEHEKNTHLRESDHDPADKTYRERATAVILTRWSRAPAPVGPQRTARMCRHLPCIRWRRRLRSGGRQPPPKCRRSSRLLGASPTPPEHHRSRGRGGIEDGNICSPACLYNKAPPGNTGSGSSHGLGAQINCRRFRHKTNKIQIEKSQRALSTLDMTWHGS